MNGRRPSVFWIKCTVYIVLPKFKSETILDVVVLLPCHHDHHDLLHSGQLKSETILDASGFTKFPS